MKRAPGIIICGLMLLSTEVAQGAGLCGKHKHGCGVCRDCALCVQPCDACCVADPCETAKIEKLICVLGTHPCARERENAAERLAKVRWRCHPDVVAALCAAMLSDCSSEVREEAADSLKEMRVHTPEAVAALHQAVEDCDRGTRRQAANALVRIERCCADRVTRSRARFQPTAGKSRSSGWEATHDTGSNESREAGGPSLWAEAD